MASISSLIPARTERQPREKLSKYDKFSLPHRSSPRTLRHLATELKGAYLDGSLISGVRGAHAIALSKRLEAVEGLDRRMQDIALHISYAPRMREGWGGWTLRELSGRIRIQHESC